MLSIAELKIPRYIQGHSFINSPEYKPRKLLYTATDRFDGRLTETGQLEIDDINLLEL